jgi:hypothetical protein
VPDHAQPGAAVAATPPLPGISHGVLRSAGHRQGAANARKLMEVSEFSGMSQK